MNNVTKPLPFYCLLLAFQYLHASKITHQLSKQDKPHIVQLSQPKRKLLVSGYTRGTRDIPNALKKITRYFLHDNPLQYRGKKLPADLSGQDLRGFDFTGCDFSYTYMHSTNLQNAILCNTRCDYIKSTQDKGGCLDPQLFTGQLLEVYLNVIDCLRKIADVYPKLSKSTQKARLLHIASNLAELWLGLRKENINSVGINRGREKEYALRMYYDFFALWVFKEKLKNDELKYELTSFLNPTFQVITHYFCWESNYAGVKWNRDNQGDSSSMSEYGMELLKGIISHNKNNKRKKGYYYNVIVRNILDLQSIYYRIKDSHVQQEVCNIACGLAKSYQFSGSQLFEWYLYWLIRLGQLKNNQLKTPLKEHITYTPIPYPVQLAKPYKV